MDLLKDRRLSTPAVPVLRDFRAAAAWHHGTRSDAHTVGVYIAPALQGLEDKRGEFG
jgi:hypothetical protein